MSSQRLLIRNGFVVSMDPEIGELPNGDVLVEDGKVQAGVRNFRFNESPVTMLNNIEEIGKPVIIGGGRRGVVAARRHHVVVLPTLGKLYGDLLQ